MAGVKWVGPRCIWRLGKASTLAVAVMLVKKGAKVDPKDKQGKTPLDLAGVKRAKELICKHEAQVKAEKEKRQKQRAQKRRKRR